MTFPSDATFVDACLDMLLPGDGLFPAATATGAPREFLARCEAGAALAGALDTLRTALPADFAVLDEAARVASLKIAEAKEPAAFAAVLIEAFAAYYMDGAVMAALRAQVGYSGTPPQPGGRALPAFDPAILPARRIAAKTS